MRTKLIVGSLLALSALSASAALLDSVNIPKTPQQEAKIELGKMLWFDPRLSLSVNFQRFSTPYPEVA